MPKIPLTLPTGESVTVLCRAFGFDPHLNFLNKVRNNKATDEDEHTYNNMKAAYARYLADLVSAEIPGAGAIIMPPSSRNDAVLYRDAILAKRELLDLSSRMTRRGEVKAADNDTTLEEVIDEFIYKPSGDEASIKSLIIVDETMGRGKTVAAILHHLRAAGLPNDCEISVAAALLNKR